MRDPPNTTSPSNAETVKHTTDLDASNIAAFANTLIGVSVLAFWVFYQDQFVTPALLVYCIFAEVFVILWMFLVVSWTYRVNALVKTLERSVSGAKDEDLSSTASPYAQKRLWIGVFMNFYVIGALITVTGGPTASPFSPYGVAMLVMACVIARRPASFVILLSGGILFYYFLAFQSEVVWESVFGIFIEIPIGEKFTKYFVTGGEALTASWLQGTQVVILGSILVISLFATQMQKGWRVRTLISIITRAALAAKVPLGILTLMIAGSIAAAAGWIPEPSRWGDSLSTLFREYGTSLVGLGLICVFAFFENIAGINTALPFSIVILAAMAMTSGHPAEALQVFFAIYLSTIVALHANYAFVKWFVSRGRGFKSVSPKESEARSIGKWTTYFVTMWHPHLAAITCVRAGEEFIPYRRFATLLFGTLTPWHLFWGVTMYMFGQWIGQSGPVLVILAYVYVGYLVIIGILSGLEENKGGRV